MVAYWGKTRDGNCPDCGMREDGAHLIRYPSHSRTTLLHEQVEDFVRWIESNDTSSEVSFWVSKYILLRNTQKLSSFANILESMKHFAAEQDAIIWRKFTEGRISKALFEVQRVHLDQV